MHQSIMNEQHNNITTEQMKHCKITNECKGKTKVTKTVDLKKEYGPKYFGVDRINTCDTCGKSYIVRTTI